MATLLFVLLAASVAVAQDRADENHRLSAGMFFDLTHIQNANSTLFGVGERASFNVRRHLALEAELSYDFSRTRIFNPDLGPTQSLFSTVDVHATNGLFGPKLQTKGRMSLFVEAKVGFLYYNESGRTIFNGTLFSLEPAGFTHFSVFPGGGAEFGRGKFRFRLDAGDDITSGFGARNNFKLMIGPTVHF